MSAELVERIRFLEATIQSATKEVNRVVAKIRASSATGLAEEIDDELCDVLDMLFYTMMVGSDEELESL